MWSENKEDSTGKEESADKRESIDLSDMPSLQGNKEEVREGKGIKTLTREKTIN